MVDTKNEQSHHEHLMNPMLIESFFDGELKSEELEAISREDVEASETWKALEQLRSVVRTESELALDDVDGFSLLEAIHKDIDDYESTKIEQNVQMVSPVVQPSRQVTPRRGWTRWIPAIVGAALFLLSIPGLVQMFGHSTAPVQDAAPTLVYLDGNARPNAQDVVCPAPSQYWQDAQNIPTVANPHPSPDYRPKGEQLTVEEMDNAIRLLIRRIETLEEANQQRVEKGDLSLQQSPSDGPGHQM